jgi:hypothetical protein
MVTACPHCGKRLRADDALAGKIATCPACKQRFTIGESTSKAVEMEQTESQSPETRQAATPVSSSGADANRPGSIHDPEPSAEKEASLTEAEQDFGSTPPTKLAKRSTKKRLLVVVVLASLVACAVIVAGAMYLYPETQGPLTVYVVPHVDDIDGGIDKDWFSFFDQLRRWHDSHSIPACFAVYPETMNDEGFNKIIAEMYASENVEVVLKGEDQYQGKKLDQMSSEQVLQVLKAWQNKFVSELQNLGRSDVQPPVTYNQLMMGLTEAIRDAARKARFKFCLEFGGSEHGYIDMLPDLDITQYSVSLTRSAEAGPEEEFKTPEEVIEELVGFESDYLIYINGIKVVPLLCSQRDFRRSGDSSSKLDDRKWKTYTSLLRRAKKDSRIRLLTAREVYDLRHSVETR